MTNSEARKRHEEKCGKGSVSLQLSRCEIEDILLALEIAGSAIESGAANWTASVEDFKALALKIWLSTDREGKKA